MTRMMLWLLILLLFTSLSGCEKPPVHAEVEGVILNATAVQLGSLVAAERKDLDRCCRYIGVDPKGRKKFTPAEGYWIRLSIDNQKLAQASLLNSCGPSLRPQRCEAKELEEKIQFAFDSRQFSAMYGKGLTRFILYDAEGNKLDKTEKHDGHKIASLRRDGNTDYFTIGPVNIKPGSVSIFMSTSLQEFKIPLSN